MHFFGSVGALFAAGVFVLRRRADIDALGASWPRYALTFVLGSRFVGGPEHPVGGGLLAFHVTVNVLGDALFLLASGAAVLYLVEERRLKQKRGATLFGRLPPLDALDRAEHRLLLSGFPLLTLGIITGTAWAHRIESGSSAETARALFAYATWVLFAAVLVLRALLGWRGRRAAYGTLMGFAFAVAVLVVYLVRGRAVGASVIVVVGLSHRKAPIEVRERVAVDSEGVSAPLSVRSSRAPTFARSRVFRPATGSRSTRLLGDERRRAPSGPSPIPAALEEVAAKNGATSIAPYLYSYENGEAVRHLFRVASSLDSLVIGEPEILGQLKDAFELAKGAGAVGKYLDRALSRALRVGKRVRTETAIGAGQVSVSSVAIDLARQIFGELGPHRAAHRRRRNGRGGRQAPGPRGLPPLEVVNRSPERAATLAREVGGEAPPLGRARPGRSSTPTSSSRPAARRYVVTRDQATGNRKVRRGRSLFFIDIAVPRDIDPAVNKLDNIYLYDVDDLSKIVADRCPVARPRPIAPSSREPRGRLVRVVDRGAQRDRHHRCSPSQGARIADDRAREEPHG